eukprot:702180-Amphidinium_carterae.1
MPCNEVARLEIKSSSQSFSHPPSMIISSCKTVATANPCARTFSDRPLCTDVSSFHDAHGSAISSKQPDF